MENIKNSVAIIGAGPIGLYLAWQLKKKGFNVTVFEKKDGIYAKPCSGLISERIKKFIPIPDSLYQRKADSVLVHFPKRDIRLKPKPSFLVFERQELDQFIFNLAKKEGVRFVFETEVDKVPQGFSKIIGCDGVLSKTRELLSLPSPIFRLGLQYFVDESSSDGEIEIWEKFFQDSPKNGFFWKIPKTGRIEYGGIGPSTSIKEGFEEFCQEQEIHLESNKLKAALIPQGISLPDSGDITLCGDAIGLTKPTTGGGIIWGLTAADILIKYFSDFTKYKKEIEKFFKPKIFKGKTEVALGNITGNHFSFLLPKNFAIDADLF
ncbi:MAG: FAD-dependent oxidoreductase [Patescibacteria group bacterium]|nr:FAD-dependent oxidoreductase [Patescibacteria group bacterium]